MWLVTISGFQKYWMLSKCANLQEGRTWQNHLSGAMCCSKVLSPALWKCKNVQLGGEPAGVKTTQIYEMYWSILQWTTILSTQYFRNLMSTSSYLWILQVTSSGCQSLLRKLQNRTRVFITTLYPKDTSLGAASWCECVECAHLVYVAKILIWFNFRHGSLSGKTWNAACLWMMQ